MTKPDPTRFHHHYGHVIYFYQPLQSFNKTVLHWIWIHVNSWHQLCITSSRTFKFDLLESPPPQYARFTATPEEFAFLLPVAAYAFFFLTNVQNLYPDLHIKTQPKQQKSTSRAHTSYFFLWWFLILVCQQTQAFSPSHIKIALLLIVRLIVGPL